MIIVVSPAKNLDFASRYDIQVTQPRLLECTHELITTLRKKSVKDIENLMGISTSLATLNVQRYHDFEKNPSTEHSNNLPFLPLMEMSIKAYKRLHLILKKLILLKSIFEFFLVYMVY